MTVQLFRRFPRDAHAGTSLMIALMLVPLILAGGSAVDFSRVASARAQLQAAVDAAAISGVGAYQTNQQGTAAYTVALKTFQGTAASVTSYATINSTTIGTGCTGSTSQCGTASGSATNLTCASEQDYCVQVSATATLNNSLLAGYIPTDILSVSATANTQTVLGAQNFSGTNVASAYDNNAIYAYPVPMTGLNSSANYTALPTPSGSCTGPITNGVLAAELAAGTSGSASCQYYQIGSSTGTASAPQTPIAVASNQPIAFLFVNVTGGTTQYGYTPVGTSTGAVSTPLLGAGFCPVWTLYGSISQEGTATPPTVPLVDSTHIYSSAYEMYGLPPTYSSSPTDEESSADPAGINQPFGTNRRITSFPIPAGTNVGSQYIITGISHGTVSYGLVQNYLTTAVFQCPAQAGWTATYYPGNRYYESSGGFTGPLVVGGCTPNTSGTWNYSASNLRDGFCSPGLYNSQQQLVSTTVPTAQASQFNNCALLIEPLGALPPGVNTPPVSFTVGTSTEKWTQPGTTSVTSFQATTLNPSTAANTVSTYAPPLSTSYQCYNPSAGYDSGTSQFGYTLAEAKAYDYIENPGLGAIICGAPAANSSPNSYGLYWNDMGGNEDDDLGYRNAITLFTCSVPGGGGGPAILSH